MRVCRTSLVMPCSRLDDLPTHVEGNTAAELLAAWTVLWHPALIAAAGGLPGWHSADEPPDPESLSGELVVLPPLSRDRLPSDWLERLRATCPRNPPAVEAVASREATLADALSAASIAPDSGRTWAADFLALGYAHLQVELLTRAMHYSTVLEADQFRSAVIEAAQSALAGNDAAARAALGRAFDLLTDARNHFYAVDFYLVDVTLLAGTTLGESLRAKLAGGPPTNLLTDAALLEQMALAQPRSLAAVRRAIEAERACLVGGPMRGASLACRNPEGMLGELLGAREVLRRLLDCQPVAYGQFSAAYSPLLPEILSGLGFTGALYAGFDGSRWPWPPQPKSRWGPHGGPAISILSSPPRDVAEPNTWLRLGQRIGESLARDHVATVLFAGWPGHACEYYDDLRRIAEYGPTLGKFVTLEEYFRTTMESDAWTTFFPDDYPNVSAATNDDNPISSRVAAYRRQVTTAFERLSDGLADVAGIDVGNEPHAGSNRSRCAVVLNPWNFAGPRFVGFDPLNFASPVSQSGCGDENTEAAFVADVPGCGYAALMPAKAPPVPRAEGRTLRNEFLEVVISERTGGIQSIRAHRDRATRVSQRLVYVGRKPAHRAAAADEPTISMLADRIEVTRADAVVGEIAARGRLVAADAEPLARFRQTVRLVSGLPAVIVGVELDECAAPEGGVWDSYIASRLAWRDEPLGFRRGVDWVGRATNSARIESPDWIEIRDEAGQISCFALGLPFHCRSGPNWLDTLLVPAGETCRSFQLAIGLDCRYPTQTALALLTAGKASSTNLQSASPARRGWFLHAGAGNVVVTHVELLAGAVGIRARLLETEGRGGPVSLAAFRPFRAAWRTDLCGRRLDALPVVDGAVQLDLGPHRWWQLEAEW